MPITGILLLGGFVLFAALMVTRILPALLVLPLMAGWIAWCAGLPFLTWANEVLLGGALRLSSAIALVVFGSMFAKIIQKTGISDAIIKKAAGLAGDRPISIAFLMLASTAFVFTGMNGLGAVLMVGSIVLPIMTSTGISPLDAAAILLMGINLGLMANIASYGSFIGIFGSEVALYYYFPGIITVLQSIMKKIHIAPEEVVFIAHGTTQATNALLEGDVAVTGVLAIGSGMESGRVKTASDVGDIPLAPGKFLSVIHEFVETEDAAYSRKEIDEKIEELKRKGAQVIVATESLGVDNPANEDFVAYYGVPSDSVEKITGFDEGYKPGWLEAFKKRGIIVYGNIERKLGEQVLRNYAAKGGTIYQPHR